MKQVIKNNKSLAEAITYFENVQKSHANLLQHQFEYTLENLNPLELIKEKIRGIFSAPILKNDAVKAAIGIGAGLLTNTLIVGASGGLVRKIMGSLLQSRISKLIHSEPKEIKQSGITLLQSALSRIKIK